MNLLDLDNAFPLVRKMMINLQGFRNRDLRQALEPDSETDPAKREKAANRMTRLLRMLCAHGLIFKIAGRSYYRITKRGRELMATALKFRDSNVALLACSNFLKKQDPQICITKGQRAAKVASSLSSSTL
ncbi:MAG: hypothetical protein ACREXW_11645 [Gammaproteobacteria bacterium]